MAYPDLPQAVKAMHATSNMRWYHNYWHLVKSRDFVQDPRNAALVAALKAIGWTSRFTGEPGAGLDFLSMHRNMIAHVDGMLAQAGDPKWPKVEGWAKIPPSPTDPDWPEPTIPDIDNPEAWPESQQFAIIAIADARAPASLTENLAYADQFRDVEFLRRAETTLDLLGYLIEVTVHNWAHMRFSAAPPNDLFDEAVTNDWLGNPFSSHVNRYFWKLHGWIDDCIGRWESARGETADLSKAWIPPSSAPPPDQLSGMRAMIAANRASSDSPLGTLRRMFAFPVFFASPEDTLADAKALMQKM